MFFLQREAKMKWCKVVIVATMAMLTPRVSAAYVIQTRVLKACERCALPAALPCASIVRHWDKAATWIPDRNIRIHGVSIAENSEVALYIDIEVSTAPLMYLTYGHIFRMKYAGPGILRDPPCDVSFSGSNNTATNIMFPKGSYMPIAAWTPIYVHIDAVNWTPYDINPMSQDVTIYYSIAP